MQRWRSRRGWLQCGEADQEEVSFEWVVWIYCDRGIYSEILSILLHSDSFLSRYCCLLPRLEF